MCEIFTAVVSELQRGPHVVLKALSGHKYFFLTQIRKNRCDSSKKVGHVYISIVAISVGLPAAFKILFSPAMQDFNKSVQMKAFASKTATSAVIVGTPIMIN